MVAAEQHCSSTLAKETATFNLFDFMPANVSKLMARSSGLSSKMRVHATSAAFGRGKEKQALLNTAVPEFQSCALLSQNSRDIFFSPNGGRTGTAVLSSA